ncbi:MAG: hypothetical protein GF329_22715 [Candidatus Lokiarchaeota archaeon]|nr:hypothetical protein [Candidatus Lokiarchaeota archaeon]
MVLIWINDEEQINVAKIPAGIQLYAKEFDHFCFNYFYDDLVQSLFEKSKSCNGEKMELIISLELTSLSFSRAPMLISYDYEFLLCLEYIFLENKNWRDCRFLASLFDTLKDTIPSYEEDYISISKYLKNSYKSKLDIKAEF